MAKKQTSKLLIECNPLPIIPELAVEIGVPAAVILQQIHYWVEVNRENGKNLRDGHYWTYNTFDSWQEQFPFWGLNTIKRAIKRLKADGLIITGNYNKRKGDNTVWYRVNPAMYKTQAKAPDKTPEQEPAKGNNNSIWPS